MDRTSIGCVTQLMMSRSMSEKQSHFDVGELRDLHLAIRFVVHYNAVCTKLVVCTKST